MSDIVVRLRSDFPTKKDCVEAANEIDRLRALCAEHRISSKPPKVTKVNLDERGQHYDFLVAFSIHQNATADEMAEYLEIPVQEYGWWTKVSDLKSNQYIEWTGEKRRSRRGGSVEVYRITDKGLDALNRVRGRV
jgi:predicted transcriptional regulator YdeE